MFAELARLDVVVESVVDCCDDVQGKIVTLASVVVADVPGPTGLVVVADVPGPTGSQLPVVDSWVALGLARGGFFFVLVIICLPM